MFPNPIAEPEAAKTKPNFVAQWSRAWSVLFPIGETNPNSTQNRFTHLYYYWIECQEKTDLPIRGQVVKRYVDNYSLIIYQILIQREKG